MSEVNIGTILQEVLGASHPRLARGIVWCRTCGRSQSVKGADGMAHGWPVCCRETMTIDSPEERAALTPETPNG